MVDVVDRLVGVSSGLAIKAPVRVATTANITLSGTQTIDGVAVVAEDRVLVKNQTDQTKNGIWVAKATAWERAKDFDGNRDIVQGSILVVVSGTLNANTYWRVTAANPITIGTTSITFERAFANDASLVSFVGDGVGGVARAVSDALQDVVNVFSYMTQEQRDDVRAGTCSIDVSGAVQAAITYAILTGRKRVYGPSGVYRIEQYLNFTAGLEWIGDGSVTAPRESTSPPAPGTVFVNCRPTACDDWSDSGESSTSIQYVGVFRTASYLNDFAIRGMTFIDEWMYFEQAFPTDPADWHSAGIVHARLGVIEDVRVEGFYLGLRNNFHLTTYRHFVANYCGIGVSLFASAVANTSNGVTFEGKCQLWRNEMAARIDSCAAVSFRDSTVEANGNLANEGANRGLYRTKILATYPDWNYSPVWCVNVNAITVDGGYHEGNSRNWNTVGSFRLDDSHVFQALACHSFTSINAHNGGSSQGGSPLIKPIGCYGLRVTGGYHRHLMVVSENDTPVEIAALTADTTGLYWDAADPKSSGELDDEDDLAAHWVARKTADGAQLFQGAPFNRLLNGSFEDGAHYWKLVGTATWGTHAFNSSNGYEHNDGFYSQVVNTPAAGDGISQPVFLKAGTVYTLSGIPRDATMVRIIGITHSDLAYPHRLTADKKQGFQFAIPIEDTGGDVADGWWTIEITTDGPVSVTLDLLQITEGTTAWGACPPMFREKTITVPIIGNCTGTLYDAYLESKAVAFRSWQLYLKTPAVIGGGSVTLALTADTDNNGSFDRALASYTDMLGGPDTHRAMNGADDKFILNDSVFPRLKATCTNAGGATAGADGFLQIVYAALNP